MDAFVAVAAVGILISVLGIINMTGNISSLHSYHRHRVTEENRKPFGRLVGAGTLTVGLSCIAFGVLFLAYEATKHMLWMILGIGLLFGGIAVGLGISFYAMIKYNGGIF